MTALRARSVRLDDVDQLVVLFDQLGYPQSRDALRGAVETAVADPRAAVLVADDSGTLVGAATYFLVPVVHDSPPLVPDHDPRGGRSVPSPRHRPDARGRCRSRRSGRGVLAHRSHKRAPPDQCTPSL